MKTKYLKIIAFFALVIILLQSCDGNVYPTEESNKNNKLKREITSRQYYIYIIDSCEYIKIEGQYGVAHKGNCKFCEERRRRENKY